MTLIDAAGRQSNRSLSPKHGGQNVASSVATDALKLGNLPYLLRACEVEPLDSSSREDCLRRFENLGADLRCQLALMPPTLEYLRRVCKGLGRNSQAIELERLYAATVEGWRSGVGQERYFERLEVNKTMTLSILEDLLSSPKVPWVQLIKLERTNVELCRRVVAAQAEISDCHFIPGGNELVESIKLPKLKLLELSERIVALDSARLELRKLLIESNSRMLLREVRKFRGDKRGKLAEDLTIELFNEGAIALGEVVDRWNSSKGSDFYAYGKHRVRRVFGLAVKLNKLVNVPDETRRLARRFERSRAMLEQQSRAPVADHEVERYMGISRDQREFLQAALQASRPRGLIGDWDADVSLTAPDVGLAERDDVERVRDLTERLFTDKRRAVIEGRFLRRGEGPGDRPAATSERLGRELGVSHQRVSELQQEAINILTDYYIISSGPTALRGNICERLLSEEDARLLISRLGIKFNGVGIGSSSGVEESSPQRRLYASLAVLSSGMILSTMGESQFGSLLNQLNMRPGAASSSRLKAFSSAASKLIFSPVPPTAFISSDIERRKLSELRKDFSRGVNLVSSYCRDFWRQSRPFD